MLYEALVGSLPFAPLDEASSESDVERIYDAKASMPHLLAHSRLEPSWWC